MTKYAMTLKTLKSMTEKQLIEMFHDLDDLEAVERIADCAYHYLENCEGSDLAQWKKDNFPSIGQLNKMCQAALSEQEEWKEDDDYQRAKDLQPPERPY